MCTTTNKVPTKFDIVNKIKTSNKNQDLKQLTFKHKLTF